MANLTDKKFGVVHTSPSNLITNAASLEDGKLYFAAGDASGLVKQGIYGVVGLTTDGSIVIDGTGTDKTIAMFGTGAIADGNGYGLSQHNFTDAFKTKLEGIDVNANNYIHPEVTTNADENKKLNAASGYYISGISRDASGHIVDISTLLLSNISVENANHSNTADDSSRAEIAAKVANKLTIKGDGNIASEFDGSVEKEINIVSGTNVSISTSDNNITISADIPGALIYMGTVSSINDINAKSCTDENKGETYVASNDFEGTITQNEATYKIEKGDMFICNGSSWDIVNGEGQVENKGATISYNSSSTIATVDGVDINITGPSTPVTKFGGKTGDITLGTATTNNDAVVNFVMNENQLTGNVPSLANYVKLSSLSSYLTKADASTTYLKISDASYFNTVKVGTTNIVADSSKDILTFAAGNNINIDANATNDTITISSTDTKLTVANINADTDANDPSTSISVNVVLNENTTLTGSDGQSITGSFSAVKVPTQKAIDNAKSEAIEAATVYWETL